MLEVDLARYLAPPLAWIVPLIRPKRRPAHRARVLDFARAMAAEDGDAARLRRDARRPGLRLFPHRRHHRPAEGGAAPGERHPLQRLVRQVLHLHRGGRADVPAAAVPRLRRLSDPDVLPDDRGADGDADAAGLSRRGRDGQLLEADRAAQGHLPHHRADRGRGADAAQGRCRRLDAAAARSAGRRRCRSSSSTASRRRPGSR